MGDDERCTSAHIITGDVVRCCLYNGHEFDHVFTDGRAGRQGVLQLSWWDDDTGRGEVWTALADDGSGPLTHHGYPLTNGGRW